MSQCTITRCEQCNSCKTKKELVESFSGYFEATIARCHNKKAPLYRKYKFYDVVDKEYGPPIWCPLRT